MSVPLWVWGVTAALVVAIIVFDFYSHVRTPHEPTFRESARWSIFYIALPLLGPYSNNRIIRYFTPPRLIVVTALCGFLARSAAHYLEDAGYYPNGPLDGNIAEFREFFTYYLTMLYVLGLAKVLQE